MQSDLLKVCPAHFAHRAGVNTQVTPLQLSFVPIMYSYVERSNYEKVLSSMISVATGQARIRTHILLFTPPSTRVGLFQLRHFV